MRFQDIFACPSPIIAGIVCHLSLRETLSCHTVCRGGDLIELLRVWAIEKRVFSVEKELSLILTKRFHSLVVRDLSLDVLTRVISTVRDENLLRRACVFSLSMIHNHRVSRAQLVELFVMMRKNAMENIQSIGHTGLLFLLWNFRCPFAGAALLVSG